MDMTGRPHYMEGLSRFHTTRAIKDADLPMTDCYLWQLSTVWPSVKEKVIPDQRFWHLLVERGVLTLNQKHHCDCTEDKAKQLSCLHTFILQGTAGSWFAFIDILVELGYEECVNKLAD